MAEGISLGAMDVISRDILEWARDLAHIRELIAADVEGERAVVHAAHLEPSGMGVVTPLRRSLPETVA